jgi:hypothetical protein
MLQEMKRIIASVIFKKRHYNIATFNCFHWREAAIEYAIVQARERNPQTWRTFCKCTRLYMNDYNGIP